MKKGLDKSILLGALLIIGLALILSGHPVAGGWALGIGILLVACQF
jgi:hypothetical protein